MLTAINLELDEKSLCSLFSSTRMRLSDPDEEIYQELCVTKLSDGIVYSFGGIHSVASIGKTNNKIFQVIIVNRNTPGITIIDTKTASRKFKPLTRDMGLFFTTLHVILVDPKSKDNMTIRVWNDNSLQDFREQIIIDNRSILNV